MVTVSALVLAGDGLNCEAETARALERAGARTRIQPARQLQAQDLADAQILAIPGGFSYADHTGAGNALAAALDLALADHLRCFAEDPGRLMIGICNGCQVLTALGLVARGRDSLTLTANASGRYEDRWVHLKVEPGCPSPWLQDLQGRILHWPVAHGEGRFLTDPQTLPEAAPAPALRFVRADGSPAEGRHPDNPNGSPGDAAAYTDASGRILALMPHPERAQAFHHRPDWPREADRLRRVGQPVPEEGSGLDLFRSALRWFA